MKRRVAFLDVFAERPLAGNGLAVVDDADGVSDETMLAFAARDAAVGDDLPADADARTAPTTATGSGRRARRCPSPGIPRWGPRSRWRAGAGDEEAALVQQTRRRAAADRGAARRRGGGRRRALARLDAAGAGRVRRRSSTAARRCAAVGLDAGRRAPRAAAAARLDRRSGTRSRPLADRRRAGAGEPRLPRDRRAARPRRRGRPLPRLVRARIRARPRAQLLAHRCALGEDPATGSAVGPLCAYLAERTGLDAITVEPGRRDGAPEPARGRDGGRAGHG